MRKLVIAEFLTLDGVMEDTVSWRLDYAPDDAGFKYDELFESDALLLGRVTYEGFAKYWASKADTNAFSSRSSGITRVS
ncbi:MAG: hypothetical protein ACK41E_02080 [Deinococcales bacterium]